MAMIDSYKPLVIGITEVKPKNLRFPVTSQEFSIDGYDIHDTLAKQGRGVILYTHKSLQADNIEFEDFPNQDAVFVTIDLQNGDTLLAGVVYRSPSSDLATKKNLNDLILAFGEHDATHKLLMGDFNYKEVNWNDNVCLTSLEHPSYKFFQTVQDAYLIQHQMEPTHFRHGTEDSLLDLIFTNEEDMVSDLNTLAPIGKSDHATLKFTFNCNITINSTRTYKYLYDKGEYKKIAAKLDAVDWNNTLQDLDVCSAWSVLTDELDQAIDEHIPKKNFSNIPTKHKSAPWMDTDTLKKIKDKQKLFRKWMETKNENDRLSYCKARNQIRKVTRNAIKSFEKGIASQAKSNSKHFWNYVRTKLKTKQGVAELKKNDGTRTTNDTEKAEELSSFFQKVFTKETEDDIPELPELDIPELDSLQVEEEDVLKHLKSLKINKSPGPDDLHPRILSELSKSLARPLTIIYQKSLSAGRLPEDWKTAFVCPIYKKGPKEEPSNYRPVSLTSVACKVLEKIIRKTVVDHLQINNILHDDQHGFVEGRSCSTQLLEALEDWTQTMDEGGCVDVIYMDFQKAFDTVPHRRLLTKLERYGIKGDLLMWIKSFLTGRRQAVIVNGERSDWGNVTSGIPQGSVLGPTLFILFINDLPDNIQSQTKMFADDTKLYGNPITANLQSDLDRLQDWSDKWLLRFHPDKCGVLRIGKENPETSYHMKDENNEEVILRKLEIEKDLGIHVDGDLSFRYHIAQSISKANRLLGLIRRSFSFLDKDIFPQLYKGLVRPLLEYGHSVWTPHFQWDIEELEAVQRRATKLIPGFSNLPYPERLKSLRLPTLTYRRARGDMIEVFKYVTKRNKTSTNILPFKSTTGTPTRGHPYTLSKTHCKLDTRKFFFTQRVVNLWNALPSNVVLSPTLNTFKNRLDKSWVGVPFLYDHKILPYYALPMRA